MRRQEHRYRLHTHPRPRGDWDDGLQQIHGKRPCQPLGGWHHGSVHERHYQVHRCPRCLLQCVLCSCCYVPEG